MDDIANFNNDGNWTRKIGGTNKLLFDISIYSGDLLSLRSMYFLNKSLLMFDRIYNDIYVSEGRNFRFYMKYFIFFMLLFYGSIVVGTVTHEIGHITVAKLLDYNVKMDYHSMDWYKSGQVDFVKPINHDILITWGGVIVTCLISIFSLYLLIQCTAINIKFWVYLFCSLFISRQIVNLLLSIIGKLYLGKQSYFGGDELALSQMHNLNEGTISIITAIIATIVCSYVIFVILPKKYLISFFAASLIGGISGYYLWFCKLGPYVLPAIQ